MSEMYEIRKITPSEVDEAIKLSEYSFKYKLEGERRVQRAKAMESQVIFGAFCGGEMVAKTHVIPLAVTLDGKEYSMGGIASVATYPDHRRKGIVNRLMDTALAAMRHEGQLLSYLHPFDISFYRRYGFELISNYKKTIVLARDLHCYRDVGGRVVRQDGFGELKAIDYVYAAWCNQYNGMLARTENWWCGSILGQDTTAVYYDEDSQPRGYLLYNIEKETMHVTEYAYLDEGSRRGLWNFIANHDSMVEQVVITSTEQEPMSFLFSNPEVKIELIPDFMGRVVLVKEFLERYIGSVQAGFKLVLTVRDEGAAWNSGVYRISEDGVLFEMGGAPEGLLMDINTFTALFFGSQKLEFLCECGRIAGDLEQADRLRRVLSTKQCAFLDYF